MAAVNEQVEAHSAWRRTPTEQGATRVPLVRGAVLQHAAGLHEEDASAAGLVLRGQHRRVHAFRARWHIGAVTERRRGAHAGLFSAAGAQALLGPAGALAEGAARRRALLTGFGCNIGFR